jgi:peptidylprolyl isomerase
MTVRFPGRITRRALALLTLFVALGTVAAQDKKEAPMFPDVNAKDWKDVKDGLKSWDVTEGKGTAAEADSMITINYTGWLTNGKKFDSSFDAGAPATFPLQGLIEGWKVGIPGMKDGGKRRLLIPAKLGYGDRGAPPDIPGGATLVFEIEMIRVWALPDLTAKEWKEVADTGGLKMWDVKEGKGKEVKAGEQVTIHYTGWTTNGKIFDSSHKRGQMATFPLNNLIKGWQIGVPGMKPGGIRRLSIPYQLAYGEAGRPPNIPAKATLIFEMELAEEKK